MLCILLVMLIHNLSSVILRLARAIDVRFTIGLVGISMVSSGIMDREPPGAPSGSTLCLDEEDMASIECAMVVVYCFTVSAMAMFSG